jgi:hypothetical protein
VIKTYHIYIFDVVITEIYLNFYGIPVINIWKVKYVQENNDVEKGLIVKYRTLGNTDYKAS